MTLSPSPENCAQTPLEDHVKYAIKRMQQGARMILDAIPNDSSLSSASFGPDVTAEIARRLCTFCNGTGKPNPPLPAHDEVKDADAVRKLGNLSNALWRDAEDELKELRALVHTQKEALEPFTKAAEALSEMLDEDCIWLARIDGKKVRLTVGDLRRARALSSGNDRRD